MPKIKKVPDWQVPMEPGTESAQGAPAVEAAPAAPLELPKVRKMTTVQMAAQAQAAQAPAPAAPVAETAQALSQPAAPPHGKDAGELAQPAVAPAPPPPPPPPPPEVPAGQPAVIELVERGMDQFAEGNLTEAAEVFQKAIDAAPDNAEGYTGLAKVWIRQDKLDEAVALLQKAVKQDPADPAAYYVLGFALRAVERNVEAAEAYERFLELMPQAADTEKMREWISHIKKIARPAAGGDEEVVVDDEQIVTELDRKYKNALSKLQEGDSDTALHDCLRILQEDPRHIRTRVLLGRAYLRQKNYDRAVEQFENALLTRSDYPEALYFLGQASEKMGLIDRASANYERYLEVAPSGPRAERLRDWLLSQSAPAAAAATGRQVQCELCLRFFPESEIAQHEGRATCRNCLAVMGGTATINLPAPTSAAAAVTAPASVAVKAPEPVRSKRGLVLLGALFVLAAAGAVLFRLGMLDPLLVHMHITKPPKPRDGPRPPPVKIVDMFDKTKVKIANDPQSLEAQPFAHWSYRPELQGVEDLDQVSPGWKKEFKLTDAPLGMALDPETGVLSWVPEFTDFAALKKGQSCSLEIAVKGVGNEQGGASREWFSVSKTLVLTSQFGYEMGPELDPGLTPAEQPALAAGDFNGDGLVDTIICTGRFRSGVVRMYLQKNNFPLPPPLELDRGTWFSAVYAGSLDGEKNGGLLVADWRRGKIKAFFQGKEGLAPGGEVSEIAVGAGPVALGVGAMEKGKPPVLAAYCSMPGQLAVTALSAGHKFGPVANIPIPGGGKTAFIFPWVSAELGAGFLAVVPLAPSPLVFVPYNQGMWDKGGKAPVSSGLEGEGLIAAAAVQACPGGKQRLALILTGKNSRLAALEEKGGHFAPLGQPEPLPSLALGLLAHDFNQDGQDDLLVVMLDACAFYFAQGNKLLPGPRITCDPRMLGPVVEFAVGPVARPDYLVINENRKAQILHPVASPKQAPAEEKK